jgi:hypothetical protein
MSVDQVGDRLPQPASDLDLPTEAVRLGDAASQVFTGELPRVVVFEGGSTDIVEDLLLSVARGDPEAFVALQNRMASLVRVNVRRVLRDASRSETVTQETFAEVLEDAINFDPDRDNGKAWLLTRAHQRAMAALGSALAAGGAGTAMIDQSAPVSLT